MARVAHPAGPELRAAVPVTARVAPRRRKPAHYGRSAGRVLIVVLAIVWILPFVLLAVTALRTPADFLTRGALSVPHSWTLAGNSLSPRRT